MNNIITYIRKVPLWKNILGVFIACISLYLFFFSTLFGIIPISFSLLLLQTEGTQIDLDSKIYRKIFSILGLNFGKWKTLPELEYISVFATTETTKVSSIGASTNITESIIALNLFDINSRKIEFNTINDKEEAFQTALHIADSLHINILDATRTNDFRWVDKDSYRSEGVIKYID